MLILVVLYAVMLRLASSADGFDMNPLILDALLEESSPEAHSFLSAIPAILEFGDQSLGQPQTRIVTLVNNNRNRSVFLDPIAHSGRTPGTEGSVFFTTFTDKVIKPQGNTTLNVVFLPKRHGAVDTDILIQTTFGLLRFPVRGRGVECPYRLTPLVGLKAPFNATISPEIHLFNPHDHPIQIQEIYSSGGHFQLELPSGGNEGPQVLWEIPPLCSKPIIRVRFLGSNPGNYSAYVRIKITGHQLDLSEKVLVVPIEVEISNEKGLYSPISFLNLGLHGSTEKISVFRLNLTDSRAEIFDSIKVTSLRGDNEITNRSLSLKIAEDDDDDVEDSRQRQLVVEVNWAKVWTPYLVGNIVIGSEVNGQAQPLYHLPIFGAILNGSAEHAGNITIVLSQRKQLTKSHGFSFTNKFSVPLMVTHVSLADDDDLSRYHLQLLDFQPVLLAPDETITLFRVQMVNYTTPISRNFSLTSEIIIMTNATHYVIPVYCYTGYLRRVVPVYEEERQLVDEGVLDFGTVPVSTSFNSNIAFINENPVKVAVTGWTGKITSSASYSIILKGCSKGPPFTDVAICSEVEPKQWMLFQITVKSYWVGNYTGQLIVTTDFEEIVTPINMIAEMGGLALDQELLHFKNCFPEKICSLNLSVRSTFMKPMHVEAISVIDGIINYEYATDEDVLPEIPPNVITNIGRLYFDPKGLCGEYCYTGSQVSNKLHPKKSSSLVNYSHYTKLDKDVLSFRIKSFHKMRSSIQTIPFKLSTSQIKRYDFVASVNFIWPRLVTEHVDFQPTQVGQGIAKFITIENPSDQLLITQYFLHDTQVHGMDVVLPPEVINPCPGCVLSKEKVFAFHSFFSTSSTLENYFDHIPPRGSSKVAIRFQAPRAGTFSTLLFIRNNLTILEAVWLTAKAVVPQLKFGNRRPGSQTPLLFELTEKHFKICADEIAEREKRLQEGKVSETESPKAIITMKRGFTARNSGEVPVTIKAIRIGAEYCEGHGFKVLNCSEFELAPNSSRKVEIAFSPDFILSRVTRPLVLETSAGFPINFTLLSTIPAEVITMCHLAQLRPTWEASFKMGTMLMLGMVLLLTLYISFADAGDVMERHMEEMSKDKTTTSIPLDLRRLNLKDKEKEETSISTTNPPASSHSKHSNFLGLSSRKKTGKKIPVGEVNLLNFTPKIQSEVPMKTSSGLYQKKEERKSQTPLDAAAADLSVKSVGKSHSPNLPRCEQQKIKRPATPPSPQEFTQTEVLMTENSQQSDRQKTSPSPPMSKIAEVTPPVSRKQHVKQPVKKTKSLPASHTDHNNISKSTDSGKIIPKINQKITENFPSSLPNERNSTPTIAEAPPSSPSPDITYEATNGNHHQNIIRPKRYGKTPGRERRSRLTKRNGLSKPTFKPSSSMMFNAPLESPSAEASASSSNIWNENRASFSYVVAQKSTTTSPGATIQSEKPVLDFGLFNEQHLVEQSRPVEDNLMNGGTVLQSWKGNDLGPIGTKKSPRSSNTPWMDVEPTRKPLAQDNFNLDTIAALQGNSSSFYSGAQSVLESYLMEQLQYTHEKRVVEDQTNGVSGGWNGEGGGQQQQQQQTMWNPNDLRWMTTTQQQSQSPIRRPPPGMDFLQHNNSNSLFMNGVGSNDSKNFNTMPTYELFSSPWEHEVTSNIWYKPGQNNLQKKQQ